MWVKKGLIKVWDGPMIDNPEPLEPRPGKPRRKGRKTGTCVDCYTQTEVRSIRCRPCFEKHRGTGNGHIRQSPPSAVNDVIDRLSRQFALNPPTLGVTCEACGCLLTCRRETCPACLSWAVDNAARASWRAAEKHYTNPQIGAAA